MLRFYHTCLFWGLWISIIGSSMQFFDIVLLGSSLVLLGLVGYSVITIALDKNRNHSRNLFNLCRVLLIPAIAQALLTIGLYFLTPWLWILGSLLWLPMINWALVLSSE